MAITYTRKTAPQVAVGDKISMMTVELTGAREYRYELDADSNTIDERPTVESVVQVQAPAEAANGLAASGPVKLFLSGGKDANSAQNLVLTANDTVLVSTGTPDPV